MQPTVGGQEHAQRATLPPRGETTDPYQVRAQTCETLNQAKRELAVSLAFARPDSPSRVPALAYLRAVNTELARRREIDRAEN